MVRIWEWIGLREKKSGKPHDFHGKIDGFRFRFSQQNQSIDLMSGNGTTYDYCSSNEKMMIYTDLPCFFGGYPIFGQTHMFLSWFIALRFMDFYTYVNMIEYCICLISFTLFK